MRKLTVMAFMSLDGVVQGPGGPDEDREGGFEHGGWAVPHFDEKLIELITSVTTRASALLLGRKTYEIFAATWPLAEADDPIGSKLNNMPKYVASRTLSRVSWTDWNGQEAFPDVSDQASAEAEQNFSMRIREREQRLIKKIDEALERMDQNIYGICERCEEEIPYPRLKARPVTTLCINCKTLQEQEEKARR